MKLQHPLYPTAQYRTPLRYSGSTEHPEEKPKAAQQVGTKQNRLTSKGLLLALGGVLSLTSLGSITALSAKKLTVEPGEVAVVHNSFSSSQLKEEDEEILSIPPLNEIHRYPIGPFQSNIGWEASTKDNQKVHVQVNFYTILSQENIGRLDAALDQEYSGIPSLPFMPSLREPVENNMMLVTRAFVLPELIRNVEYTVAQMDSKDFNALDERDRLRLFQKAVVEGVELSDGKKLPGISTTLASLGITVSLKNPLE